MKKLVIATLLVIALPVVALAQPPARNISSSTHPVTANVALAYDGTTGHLAKQAIAVLPKIVNVADLPTCSAAYFGAIATVTDGNGATDCTTGLSTTDVACECNGSAWTARYTSTADTSAYVLITQAGQQAITASGGGNDITLTAADDIKLEAADVLPNPTATFAVTSGTNSSIITTAGSITLTAGGTTQDVAVNSVDDIILTPTDALTANVGGAVAVTTTAGAIDLTAGGTTQDITLTSVDDVLVNPAGDFVVDAAGSADEVTVTANKVEIGAGVEFRIIGASAPPAACAAGTKGSIYFDTDVAKLCICNGTNYVLVNDDSTTTGCS